MFPRFSFALTSILVVATAGCAWQSEVLGVGRDTWQTSANASPARGAASGAREMALSNATKNANPLAGKLKLWNLKPNTLFQLMP